MLDLLDAGADGDDAATDATLGPDTSVGTSPIGGVSSLASPSEASPSEGALDASAGENVGSQEITAGSLPVAMGLLFYTSVLWRGSFCEKSGRRIDPRRPILLVEVEGHRT